MDASARTRPDDLTPPVDHLGGEAVISTTRPAHKKTRSKARPRRTPRRRASQQPAPVEHGVLLVITTLNGAKIWANIFLDGQLQGQSDLYMEEVKTGQHRLTIQRPGYQTIRRTIVVTPGKKTKVNQPLTPQ